MREMYNNYSQYYQPRFQQPQMMGQMEALQPQFTKPTGIQGKQVDSLDVVKATDVPFDGSVSYFPLTDGSAIVTKQLQMDGTSKIVVFKPITEEKEDKRFITFDDLTEALGSVNEDVASIKKQLKELKKSKVNTDE